jgi:hypothetical protein
MHPFLSVLLAFALVGGCASHGPWRTLEGGALGSGGGALVGEAVAGPVGLAAGALAGSGVGAFIASKTAHADKPSAPYPHTYCGPPYQPYSIGDHLNGMVCSRGPNYQQVYPKPPPIWLPEHTGESGTER